MLVLLNPSEPGEKRRRKLISNYYINDSVLSAGGTGPSCPTTEACREIQDRGGEASDRS